MLPEILAPMIIARKAVLVGDPKQLPPVFCSDERKTIQQIENCHLDQFMYIDNLFETSPMVYSVTRTIGSYGHVIDFIHVYDEDLETIGDSIEWLPEPEAKLITK